MEQTQAQILRHHGGDGEKAREMITQTFDARHDDLFWAFWQQQLHPVVAPEDVLLDLGAGTGLFVKALAERYPDNLVMGVEAADYMLAALESLPENGRILKADLNEPNVHIAPNSVAVAMANMLVHELPQPVHFFKAVYQWLKPGGRFCIIDLVRQPLSEYLRHKDPDNSLFASPITRDEAELLFEHFLEHNRYHVDDLLYLLTQSGFTLVENTPIKDGRQVRLVFEK